MIHSVGRDCTGDKLARASYDEAQARLRTLFETSLQLQGLLGVDGTLLDINATALSIFDSRLADVQGLPLCELSWFADTPGLPQRLRSAVESAARGESVRQELSIVLGSITRSFDLVDPTDRRRRW